MQEFSYINGIPNAVSEFYNVPSPVLRKDFVFVTSYGLSFGQKFQVFIKIF